MNLIEWPYYKLEFLSSQGFSKSILERFWSKIKIGDGCWEWTASRSAWGYGRIGLGGRRKGAGFSHAHRVMWIICYGPIPEATPLVLHKCDNPPCVRPDHLWLGTALDNTLDCIRKRRNGYETHPESWAKKLTPEIVLEIRRTYRRFETPRKEFAAKFGICGTTLQVILSGKAWRHV